MTEPAEINVALSAFELAIEGRSIGHDETLTLAWSTIAEIAHRYAEGEVKRVASQVYIAAVEYGARAGVAAAVAHLSPAPDSPAAIRAAVGQALAAAPLDVRIVAEPTKRTTLTRDAKTGAIVSTLTETVDELAADAD